MRDQPRAAGDEYGRRFGHDEVIGAAAGKHSVTQPYHPGIEPVQAPFTVASTVRLLYAHASAMTAPLFHIRRATLADLDALVALERRAFTTDHLSRRQYRRHLLSSTAVVLAAVDGSGLLGKAVIFFRAHGDIARLYSIAVCDEARGRGLGEAVLAAAEEIARDRRCSRMRLEVRQDNAGAIRLYERRGYQRFAARPRYYEDGADAWRYEKVLERNGPR